MKDWILALALAFALALGSVIGVGAAEGPTPTVTLSRDAQGSRVTFTGVLQTAESVGGPWNEVVGAVSPFSLDPTGTRRFYRAVEPGVSGIFASRAIVEFAVSGPLQEHFDLAFAGTPDGIFPPVREKPYFEGRLRIGAQEIPVQLRVRGNSSLQECPFPKLKFKVTSEDREGTPFSDAREVKIGTHCAEGGHGNVGRLRDERAAFREALAYEVMEVMGFVTPRVRRARIEYRDTAPAGDMGATGWQVTREAMIFDDVEVVAARLGGRALSDEEVGALTNPAFDEQLIAELQLFHALLGNWDYGLWQEGRGLWNTEVIELPNRQLLPVAGDFDLSSWVTGQVRSSAPHDYRPDLPPLERQARFEVEQIRQRVSQGSFEGAKERFAMERSEVESIINAAMIDSGGRTNALAHVAVFYGVLLENQ